MNLFVFFALPLATVLLAVVLQKNLRNPTLVAITFFAIYLIIAFTTFQDLLAEALIATIIYTVIAYITSYIVMSICSLRRSFCNCRSEEATNENNRSSELLAIDSNCMVSDTNNVLEEVTTTSNSNVATNCQFANRPVAYGNRRSCR